MLGKSLTKETVHSKNPAAKPVGKPVIDREIGSAKNIPKEVGKGNTQALESRGQDGSQRGRTIGDWNKIQSIRCFLGFT